MPGGPTLDRLLSDPTSRRRFLAGTATATAALVVASLGRSGRRPVLLRKDPFTLGVASGDPTPGGVVLWTRLAPDPMDGGLRDAGPIAVDWVVARDENLRHVVHRGTSLALAQNAHSVHVELRDLEPGRPYWFAFTADGFRSATARTKTGPSHSRQLQELRLGFCSCANWQNGAFAAYARLAEEDLDVVLHLGDYIYEYGPSQSTFPGRLHSTPEAGPKATQLTTLADYRNRHAQYKTDPALQAAHAAAPWVVVSDDHDVESNYAGAIDEEPGTDPAEFLRQRAAAYKAYYEHLPLRRSSVPVGPDMRLHRTLQFGDLVDLHMLDTRQFRTDQPVDTSTPTGRLLAASDRRPGLPPGGNPAGTLLGDAQEQWLLRGMHGSRARWTALGNQVRMARFDFGPFEPPASGGPIIYNVDSWDGYGAERGRLLDAIAADPGLNVVVLTGDAHAAFVNDLERDFDTPGTAVATEFVGTSITSDFPAALWAPVEAAAKLTSPWMRFLDARHRGYATCTVTRQEWRTDFRAVASSADRGQVVSPSAAVHTAGSFVVEQGHAGAHPA